jgi:hypothetical protein
MNTDESEKFKDLYGKILNLKTVKCRLNHERIRYDKETNLPVSENLPGEISYQNIGFCSPEIRAGRLACGHTMARYLLEDALALLESNGVETENLQNDLREATHKIHSLDHEKGFAEKHLAQLIEKQNVSAVEIERAKFSIKEIEDAHSVCVEKIGAVRDSIIFEMKPFFEQRH